MCKQTYVRTYIHSTYIHTCTHTHTHTHGPANNAAHQNVFGNLNECVILFHLAACREPFEVNYHVPRQGMEFRPCPNIISLKTLSVSWHYFGGWRWCPSIL